MLETVKNTGVISQFNTSAASVVGEAANGSDRAEGGRARGEGTASRPLRVLLIGHQFQVPSEGQAKAKALALHHDLQVHVLAPERYKEAEVRWRFPTTPVSPPYAFEVCRVANAWCGPAKWYLQWYRNLARTLRRVSPDIIDIWEEPWGMLSAQVCFLRRLMLPHCRLVAETEQNIEKVLPPPFEWFRSFTFREADFLVGRNTEALRVARSKGFERAGSVVGNGVDLAVFKPGNVAAVAACRSRFGVRRFAIGYCGRLVPEKGLYVLCQALRELGEEFELLLCGDGPMREELLTHPRVLWAGALPREELVFFYNALDALVLPSRTTKSWKEQFGRVLIEAQACGIPVIGSDSGAIPEVIGDAGMIVPEGDSHALALALLKLGRTPGLMRQLAQQGIERVTTRYSWEAIAAQMRGIYQGLHNLTTA